MERPSKGQENKSLEVQYADLIGAYKVKVSDIKKIQRRVPQGVAALDTERALRVIDEERHQTHLKLIELGQKLGKAKDDVLVDIIRKDASLESYGLPEFSILSENDIIDTGYWHNPYHFNVNPSTRRPSKEDPPDYYKEEGESVIKSDEVMFVFAIVPIENYGEDELVPPDYEERSKRATALAEEVGGRVFEERDSGYHEAYAKILGVIVPKIDLEKVATTIRDNPGSFRLKSEFYPESVRFSSELLAMAQAALKEITGEEPHLGNLPEAIKGTENLEGKRIIMIDDDTDTLASFVAPLLVATQGKATFVPYGGQTEKELVAEISASGADIVLLDYHLSSLMDGTSVAEALLDSGFPCKVVGFSSDKTADQAFKKVGTMGAINKDPSMPEMSIRKLAEVL